MPVIATMVVDSDGVIPWNGKDKHYVLAGTFDFSVAANNAASADTVTLFEVAANQLCKGISVRVTTVEGGTATVDIGLTGGDVDLFIDGADLNALGTTWSGQATTDEVVIAGGGHYFTAADTIDMLCNNALDAAVIEVRAMMVDLS